MPEGGGQVIPRVYAGSMPDRSPRTPGSTPPARPGLFKGHMRSRSRPVHPGTVFRQWAAAAALPKLGTGPQPASFPLLPDAPQRRFPDGRRLPDFAPRPFRARPERTPASPEAARRFHHDPSHQDPRTRISAAGRAGADLLRSARQRRHPACAAGHRGSGRRGLGRRTDRGVRPAPRAAGRRQPGHLAGLRPRAAAAAGPAGGLRAVQPRAECRGAGPAGRGSRA